MECLNARDLKLPRSSKSPRGISSKGPSVRDLKGPPLIDCRNSNRLCIREVLPPEFGPYTNVIGARRADCLLPNPLKLFTVSSEIKASP